MKGLTKIKELLEIIRHKVDMLGVSQTGQSASISMIRDQLSMMNSKLDSHSAALIEIERSLDIQPSQELLISE